MFVIRRHAGEAVMFEGGLAVTVHAIVDRAAWLAFTSPDIAGAVVVAVVAADPERLCVAVAGPEGLTPSADGRTTTVAVSAEVAGPAADRVLLVGVSPGQRIEFDGLSLGAAPSGSDKPALLAVEAPALGGPVELAIITVSKFDATIGVAAPPDLRVYRLEVWEQLLEANRAAAGWEAGDLAALARGGPAGAPPSG